MIRVKAKFIGADGSLGYKAGEVYDLYFFTAGYRRGGSKIEICKLASPTEGRCPYSSLSAFLKNWEVIQ